MCYSSSDNSGGLERGPLLTSGVFMNDRLVAKITERRILVVSNTPIFLAGGKAAKLTITNTEREVIPASQRAELSLLVVDDLHLRVIDNRLRIPYRVERMELFPFLFQ